MRKNEIIMNLLESASIDVSKLDFLFISVTDEARCFQSLEILIKRGIRISNICFFLYKIYDSKPNISTLKKKYKSNTATVHIMQCEKNEAAGKQILSLKIQPTDCVGFDVTGFASPDIFKIYYVLHHILGVKYILVFYTEPKYYFFPNILFNTYESGSKGRSYCPLKEYQNSSSHRSEILICFLGFDPNTARFIYENVMPEDMIIVNGFPSYLPKFKDISLGNHYDLISELGIEKVIATRANNPFATYNCLIDARKQYPDKLLNICVLGTKPMAVGAVWFALRHKRLVSVSYPLPEQFHSKTSKDCGTSWYYSLQID